MTALRITIDGTPHVTEDDDQEAAALLRLSGRDPQTHDLFVVDKQGVETHIKDNQIVNLRDNQKFRARPKIRFSIDGEPHTSWDDDQTAAALLRLAGVKPAEYDLARVNGASGPEIFTGEQMVRLRDGDEFVSAKHTGPVA
ncbi:hypothetical protein HQP42_10695 [Rhodococcus fascians]|uniref:hypothetical protein n=1 Tax=unclassified Rhodococcus (in: high G+C Gram-positive bacteria) TaxID=192944 RepID=UPI00117ABF38|nr:MULTISPECIES: hypothetical protein [unclassified Rhodococcus (in: high G+C Gram-positive bacteria)]MBY3792864.1 hypothetical protein [Rhodococcus fascians]MBY3825160.1 hypothetical protein [Rhodococcus fascians]MBY3835621.1 hypothetical protein [Rhodococcus fascians]MBY3864833.1 hypothetical protein [Rhodococcus fascians]MBY3884765.1 hypothetical protein [Rhodococcus fascians]